MDTVREVDFDGVSEADGDEEEVSVPLRVKLCVGVFVRVGEVVVVFDSVVDCVGELDIVRLDEIERVAVSDAERDAELEIVCVMDNDDDFDRDSDPERVREGVNVRDEVFVELELSVLVAERLCV